jgi:Ca2+-binding EF-hand superfamily protein
MEKNRKDELKKLFLKLDHDKNGSINREELEEHIKKVHFGITNSEIRMIFALIDENHDGKIDLKEFITAFITL